MSSRANHTAAPAATPAAVAPITYLDKFAVLPEHQGDGTVDFLWVALHDETYGLGLPFSANPNGGKEGKGEGRDLVWRSRADNPVNKWYFERSTGHLRQGDWVLFWCDAEVRLKTEEGRRAGAGLSSAIPPIRPVPLGSGFLNVRRTTPAIRMSIEQKMRKSAQDS